MSEVKHTPGPWRVREHRPHGELLECFVTAPDVHGFAYDAEILGDDEYREERGLERKLADCRLIAAAPAMYAALRDLRSYIIAYDGPHSAADLARIDAIISLAEGNR